VIIPKRSGQVPDDGACWLRSAFKYKLNKTNIGKKYIYSPVRLMLRCNIYPVPTDRDEASAFNFFGTLRTTGVYVLLQTKHKHSSFFIFWNTTDNWYQNDIDHFF
jgi:hypothetical protein